MLRAFAEKHGIEFPLLSDTGSAVITRYGLLNTTIEPTNRAYGIPHPGTFVLTPDGIVRARFFEPAYQVRHTVSGVAATLGLPLSGASSRAATRAETDHLTVVAYATDETVAPGNRFALVLEVTPKPGMHVYAPGDHPYHVITLALAPQPAVRVHPLTYPPSERYHFKPLDEWVPVFQKPFRLLQDVTVEVTPETRDRARASGARLELRGTLTYQACDERVCYPPASVPLTWTLALRPLQ